MQRILKSVKKELTKYGWLITVVLCALMLSLSACTSLGTPEDQELLRSQTEEAVKSYMDAHGNKEMFCMYVSTDWGYDQYCFTNCLGLPTDKAALNQDDGTKIIMDRYRHLCEPVDPRAKFGYGGY